eukprot:4056314-Prymnesium_polylepis.1
MRTSRHCLGSVSGSWRCRPLQRPLSANPQAAHRAWRGASTSRSPVVIGRRRLEARLTTKGLGSARSGESYPAVNLLRHLDARARALLLGRAISWRAADARHIQGLCPTRRPRGEPKVADLYFWAVRVAVSGKDEEVLWLNVAVHDARVVQELHTAGELDDPIERLARPRC